MSRITLHESRDRTLMKPTYCTLHLWVQYSYSEQIRGHTPTCAAVKPGSKRHWLKVASVAYYLPIICIVIVDVCVLLACSVAQQTTLSSLFRAPLRNIIEVFFIEGGGSHKQNI